MTYSTQKFTQILGSFENVLNWLKISANYTRTNFSTTLINQRENLLIIKDNYIIC